MRSELNGIIWEKFQRWETPTTRVPHKIQSENFETGHLFSIAKLNFESICFLAFFYLRPFKLVHRQKRPIFAVLRVQKMALRVPE